MFSDHPDLLLIFLLTSKLQVYCVDKFHNNSFYFYDVLHLLNWNKKKKKKTVFLF